MEASDGRTWLAWSFRAGEAVEGGGGRVREGGVGGGRGGAEAALRGGQQGGGGVALFLRATGALGSRRQPAARAGRDDPGPRGRQLGCRRQVGDLEAEE